MEKEQEATYLKALEKGDHDAFNVLFMSYHSLVKRFLMGFIKDEDEVSDIAQNVFIKVWTNRKLVAKAGSFKAYLFRMTRNDIYNYYKLHEIRREHIENYYTQNKWIDDVLEDKILAEELGLLFDIIIDGMPPQRKLIFEMSRKQGLANEDIARQLNINKRTVENHITLALADLRKVLKIILLFFC